MLMAYRCYPAQLRLQVRAAVLRPCTLFLTGQAAIIFVTNCLILARDYIHHRPAKSRCMLWCYGHVHAHMTEGGIDVVCLTCDGAGNDKPLEVGAWIAGVITV